MKQLCTWMTFLTRAGQKKSIHQHLVLDCIEQAGLCSTSGSSLAELMFGRKCRSRLDLLLPNLTARVESQQQRQKEKHDMLPTAMCSALVSRYVRSQFPPRGNLVARLYPQGQWPSVILGETRGWSITQVAFGPYLECPLNQVESKSPMATSLTPMAQGKPVHQKLFQYQFVFQHLQVTFPVHMYQCLQHKVHVYHSLFTPCYPSPTGAPPERYRC